MGLARADLPDADEQALWRAWCVHRSDDAVSELWRRYQRVGVAIAAKALHGVDDATNEAPGIVDEAFVRALGSFDTDKASRHTAKPFRAWFLRLVRSAALDERRRRAREDVCEAPLAQADLPGPALEARIDVRRLVGQLRTWNQDHGLEEDWPVLVAWLQCRHDGARVPWKRLAEEHVVRAPDSVAFSPGSTLLAANDPRLQLASRKLRLCPRMCVSAQGTHTRAEPDAVAIARAKVVVDALREEVRPRRASRPGGTVERITAHPQPSMGGSSVRFEVVAGGRRTPDALRMRVEKVILGKLLALVRGGEHP